MKNLKTFERFEIGDFKVGDVVICVDNTKSLKIDGIKFGGKYRVKEISTSGYLIKLTYYRKNIIIKSIDGKEKWFYANYFIPELEWEVKNYNL